mgnify:FL=1
MLALDISIHVYPCTALVQNKLSVYISINLELSNGCGASWLSSLDGPFTDSFEPACVKHDHCYNCVSVLVIIGHVNEHPTMQYFGNPRHTQPMTTYKILTEYF